MSFYVITKDEPSVLVTVGYHNEILFILDHSGGAVQLTKQHMIRLVPLGRMMSNEKKLYLHFLSNLPGSAEDIYVQDVKSRAYSETESE